MTKRILFIFMVFLPLLPATAFSGELTVIQKRRIESDVSDTLERIISLWEDEQYEALYKYGTQVNRLVTSKEEFIYKMEAKTWGLACCWETIGNIEVDVKYPTLVYATAKIGYKQKGSIGTPTKFITETYQMLLEKGKWRIDLLRILYAPD